MRILNITSNYTPALFNKALQDLPKYAGIPVHVSGAEGCDVCAASFCVYRTMTIKVTITV